LILTDINESVFSIESDNLKFKKMLATTLSPFAEGYKFSPKFRNGFWDGRVKYYSVDKGKLIIPKGLQDLVIKKLEQDSIDYSLTSLSSYEQIEYTTFCKFVDSLNLPFKPYDHQMLSSFDSINRGRLIIVSATGSGKSLIAYIICHYHFQHNRKVLLVVPSIMLTEQMFTDFKNDYKAPQEFMDEIRQIGGDNKIKKLDKQITISTWQSLQNIEKSLFKSIDVIIGDEIHQAKNSKGNVLKDIIFPCCLNAKYRVGMTGTLPKLQDEKLAVLSVIGSAKKYISTRQLIDMGLATEVEINMFYLNYTQDERNEYFKLKFDKQDELIRNHRRRNFIVSKLIHKISDKGNTLVLFEKRDMGDLILRYTVALKLGIDIENMVIISSLSPTQITQSFLEITSTSNVDTVVFNGYTIMGDATKRKIVNILKKVTDDGALIDQYLLSFRTTESLDIFTINGDINSKSREYTRKVLEDRGSDMYKLRFKDVLVHLQEDIVVLLEDGNHKLVKDIVVGDIVDEHTMKSYLYHLYNLENDKKTKDKKNLTLYDMICNTNRVDSITKSVGSTILATYSTMSTGVSIKKIKSMVFASSTKSFFRVNQSIGRGLRKHISKDMVQMFDIVDDFSTKDKKGNYSFENSTLKHSRQRLDMYIENEYNIVEREVNL
jgi:superfamily II DNA or RNA helicase